jgi:uncharacterized protein (DUF2132 family)
MDNHSNDPLHGKTLQAILEFLVEHFGWVELGQRIKINCFIKDPSIKSSLVFLRKTKWAREKVEALYLISAPRSQPVAKGGFIP